jgi:hypothetical protein
LSSRMKALGSMHIPVGAFEKINVGIILMDSGYRFISVFAFLFLKW